MAQPELEGDRLCAVCTTIDFSTLASPVMSGDNSSQTYVEGFALSKAKENEHCAFCRLVVQCASFAGAQLGPLVRLRLRPRLVQTGATDASQVRSKHSGQIHVEFVTSKLNLKKIRRIPRSPRKRASEPDGDDEDVILQRAIAMSLSKAGEGSADTSAPPTEDMQSAAGDVSSDETASGLDNVQMDFSPTSVDSEGDPPESDSGDEMQWAIAMSLQQGSKQVPELEGGVTGAHDDSASNGEGSSPANLLYHGLHEEGLAGGQFSKRTLALYDFSKAYDETVEASWLIDITDIPGSSDFVLCRTPIKEACDDGLLRSWLHHCQEDHRHHELAAAIALPLSQLPLQGHLRGINTTTGDVAVLDPQQKYAALTYVWGLDVETSSPWKAISDDRTLEGLDMYPATIRDAGLVSKSLGIEWLWVDRFSIDQSDAEERAMLMAYMKDIFAAAELTIVAASGDDVRSGLPGKTRHLRQSESTCTVSSGSDVLEMVAAPTSFNAMLQDSTWNSRGWTFEEHIFSRRLLYFFPAEIFFSCAHGTFRETAGTTFTKGSAGSSWGDRGRIPPTIGAQLHSQLHTIPGYRVTAREYIRAVEEYSSRKLTLEEDRVNAFAGLVAAALPDTAVTAQSGLLRHGHPPHLFETLLTWHHEDQTEPSSRSRKPSCTPSWSWAAAGTKARFLDNGEEHTRNRWFQYSQTGDSDVLGIPAERDIPMISNLGLPFPDHIIAEEPWMSWMATRSPTAGGEAGRVPILHLVTVVFEGLLSPASEDQHCIRPLGSSPETRARLVGPWSLSGELPMAEDDEAHPHATEAGRTEQSEAANRPRRVRFALVGGYQHMYIMLLSPGEDPSTFTRLGLSRLSLDTFNAMKIGSIMAAGAARWQYVRLL